MDRVTGFVRLIRPVNCLMMGFAVIVGAWLVTAGSLSRADVPNLVLGYVTAFTLTGASMAVNDYYDREIDAINDPKRPIPSGAVKPQESLIVAAILIVLGLAAAVLTNLPCLTVAVVSLAINFAYVTRGKRTGLPGNFLVSMCVTIPFIYGSFALGQGPGLNTGFLAQSAFSSNTGREVAKGIVDVKGDKSKKIRTVAVVYGEKAAAYVASGFFLYAVCLSLLPILLRLVSRWFILFIGGADIGFIVSSVMLVRSPTRENAKSIKNSILFWMMMVLLAFIAGTVG